MLLCWFCHQPVRRTRILRRWYHLDLKSAFLCGPVRGRPLAPYPSKVVD